MSDDGRKLISPETGGALVEPRSGLPAQVTPEEIYKKIDRIRGEMQEIPPGLLQRLVDPNARKRANAIEEARLECIQSRSALIRGMRQVIDAYIQTHVEDIKARQKSYLLPRINNLIIQLASETELSIVQMLRIAKDSADQINSIAGLPAHLRESQIEATYKRAVSKQDVLGVQQLRIIEDLANHLGQVMGT